MASAIPSYGLLLAEDHPDVVALIQAFLDRAPDATWRLEAVDRIADALARLSRPGIDAVLLDLRLLDSAGLSGLEQVRAAHPDLPVVVLTSSDEEMALEALQRGAQDYLLKAGATKQAFVPREGDLD